MESETKTNNGAGSGSSPSSCYPLVRELRKLDEAVREGNRNAALVMRASANALEKYEHQKESLRDLLEDMKMSSRSSRENHAYIVRLERILG